MANVQGPLFSLTAAGSVAKTLCYKKGKRGTVCRKWAQPGGEASSDQLNVRQITGYLMANWQNLSTLEQASWAAPAEALSISPINLYLQANWKLINEGRAIKDSYTLGTRHYYLDHQWSVCGGVKHHVSQVESFYTTLSSPATAGTNNFNVVDSSGFVQYELIAFYGPSLGTGQVFRITAIAGNTIFVYPLIKASGFPSGTRVEHWWFNYAHPSSSGYYSLANRIVSSLQSSFPRGANLLGDYGTFVTTYVNSHGKTLPFGWNAILDNYWGTTALNHWNSTTYDELAKNDHSWYMSFAGGVNSGIESAFSIPVQPHRAYSFQLYFRDDGYQLYFDIVNAENPTHKAVEAWRPVNNKGFFGTQSKTFIVPEGMTSAKIMMYNLSTNNAGYHDDFRLIPIDNFSWEGEYLLPRTDFEPVVYVGDSWHNPLADNIETFLYNIHGRYTEFYDVGVAGFRLYNMIADWPTAVEPLQPKTVILQFGANDAGGLRPSQAEMEADLTTYLDLCDSIGARCIVVGIPIMRGYEQWSHDRNDQLRALVDAR